MVIATTAVAMTVIAGPGTASASGWSGSGDPARELAERYAPVVFVKPQEAPCDTSGERSSRRRSRSCSTIRKSSCVRSATTIPSRCASDGLRPVRPARGVVLDFPGDALRPGCVFEQDFRAFTTARAWCTPHRTERLGPATSRSSTGSSGINPSKNDHERRLGVHPAAVEADSVAAALATSPTSIGTPSNRGERSDWDDPKLGKVGERPVVYPASARTPPTTVKRCTWARAGTRGSVATTRRCHSPARPERRDAPRRVTAPDDPLAWLAFQGRWASASRVSSTGRPVRTRRAVGSRRSRDRRLRDSSVVIPWRQRRRCRRLVVLRYREFRFAGCSPSRFRSPTVALALAVGTAVIAAWLARRHVVTGGDHAAQGATSDATDPARRAARVARSPAQMLWSGSSTSPLRSSAR